eukprot:Phypoly_transcript_00757.p1 GENE.Phypoly_transcript_00757~~Phypoly_transcript_00757.p1  ORF type:complete len:1255 (+),score=263.32 Phypoly_transcript_00757:153-3917(+)
MASQCSIEGCTKESTHEAITLKKDAHIKPNIANRHQGKFGLCLDHFLSESRDPHSHGDSGRMGRRRSSVSVDDGGMDDGGNGDYYNMAGGWDDPNAKEDASGLRRSNRTFKRPRKYFEDEMIVEDEAFIFDGKAIERMFKNQVKPASSQLKEKEKADAPAKRSDKDNKNKKTEQESTPAKRQETTMNNNNQKGNKSSAEKKSPNDTKKKDKGKDKDKGAKEKEKEKEKGKRKGLKEGHTPSTTKKKKKYVDCHKADRSLKLLRPFLVPTCKSHAIRVEARLGDAILGGTIQLKEGNNVKDSICGCCTGLYGKEVLRCSNENCAFSFCSKCATTLGAKNGNPGNSPKWVCWVCEASKAKSKIKERSRYIATLRQNIAQNGGTTTKTRKQDKTDSQFLQYMEEDPTATARKNSLRQVRQKIMKVPDPMELGYYYVPPAPQPPPPAAPNRNPLLDKLLESLIGSVKFFANGENFTVASAELMAKVNGVFELARLMKLARMKETEHEHVWTQVKDYADILLRNIQTAEQLLKLQNEINVYDAIPAYLAESTISKHGEMKQSVDSLREKCVSVCDATVRAIEDIRKKVDLVNHDFEVATYHRVNRETQITAEIRGLEEDIGLSATEASAWRAQEAELVERLVKVRANIARCDKQQEESTQKMTELKGELVHTRYQLRNMELNVAKVESGYSSETKAFELLAKLAEEAYWLHEYYASKKNVERDYLTSLINRTAEQQQRPVSAGTGRKKTLAVFHNACLEHTVAESCLDKPERLRVAISVIKDYKASHPHLIDINSNPPQVDNRYLMVVHDATYIKRLQVASTTNAIPFPSYSKRDIFDKNAPDFSDTPLSANSLSAAMHAAGAVCEAVDNVVRGKYAQAFCAVRPPGHHVGIHGRTKGATSQGYCLINNVAIGAKYAMLTGGYDKVAVVDIDVHHGNGTQEILQGDESFLFISTHVYEDKKAFFPGTGRDLEREQEEGETAPPTPQTPHTPQEQPRKRRKKEDLAVAFAAAASADAAARDVSNILNVGFKRAATSATVIQAIKTRVIPRLEAFQPQIILLSIGFDGHRDDPSNGTKLSDEDYYTITRLIMRVAKKFSSGRLVSVLEGGYQLERQVLKKCVQAHLRALLTDEDFVSHHVEGYTPPIPSSSFSSDYTSPNSYPPHSRPHTSPYSSTMPSFTNYNNYPNTNNNNYPTSQTYPPTSTNITKLAKSSPPFSTSSLSSADRGTVSPITIIDDPDQHPTSKPSPAPKKGSIESILL